MATFPKLKLTYFNVAGRAEAIRTMFRLGGVPFEDERVPRETFSSLKSELPYGQLPVLEVDGEVIAETQAILHYAARLGGFYPENDPVAVLMVEEILVRISELSETKMIPIIREKDADQKRRQLAAFLGKHLPTALCQIDARLKWMDTYPLFRDAPATKLYVHEIVLGTYIDLLRTDYSKFVPASATVGYSSITATHEKLVSAMASSVPPSSPPARVVTTPVPRPTKLTLTYLDFKARGEFLRLAFYIGDVPFEDERVTYEQINDRKDKLPYGQVPVLDIDGYVLAQTFALLRYAGTLSGLYPTDDPLQSAKVDEIIARVEEIYYKLQASSPSEEKDMEKRRAMREKLVSDRVLQSILMSLDKRVAQWKQSSTFVFGEKMTIADLAVYHIVDYVRNGEFDYVPVTIANNFTEMVAIHDAVMAHPRVQDWYAMRSTAT